MVWGAEFPAGRFPAGVSLRLQAKPRDWWGLVGSLTQKWAWTFYPTALIQSSHTTIIPILLVRKQSHPVTCPRLQLVTWLVSKPWRLVPGFPVYCGSLSRSSLSRRKESCKYFDPLMTVCRGPSLCGEGDHRQFSHILIINTWPVAQVYYYLALTF